MKISKGKLILLVSTMFVVKIASADQLGLSVPDTSIYYYNQVSNKVGYRFGATLGSPTSLYAMYRSRLGDHRELYWEIGISGGSAGLDVPLSLGYLYKLDKRITIEPMLSVYPVASITGLGINIGYRL